ncbi:hypothetical protein NA56DRAFT_690138 [Hyaloscypha hepaticicola]|uniref:Uncharacterized protein n=1 Tax=Hyaloscypha hepaticicola TaxID=2082293 RepID=A0A2J6Q156_9HELO|nr:hypothetical protein NA56DRAFT_690138 [Hyaloscypha hepaticicola]
MKTFTTAAFFAFVATLAAAAPTSQGSNGIEAVITFQGAAGAQFTLSVPTDGTTFSIDNALSISHIVSEGGATCGFHGIDGSETTVVGAQTMDVGPPQTQVWGSCLAL